MGIVPEKESERDKSLIEDYLKETATGWFYSISELGFKYRRIVGEREIPLTSTRIFQILAKYDVPKNRRIPTKKE